MKKSKQRNNKKSPLLDPNSAEAQLKNLSVLPIISKWPYAMQIALMLSLAAIFGALSLLQLSFASDNIKVYENKINLVLDLKMAVGQLDSNIEFSIAGTHGAIDTLVNSQQSINAKIAQLVKVERYDDPPNVEVHHQKIKKMWELLNPLVMQVEKNKEYLEDVAAARATVEKFSDHFVGTLTKELKKGDGVGSSSKGDVLAKEQLVEMAFYLARISKDANRFSTYQIENPGKWVNAWSEINKDNQSMIDVWQEINDNESGKASSVADAISFAGFQTGLIHLVTDLSSEFDGRIVPNALLAVPAETAQLTNDLNAVEREYKSLRTAEQSLKIMPIFTGCASFLFMFGFAYVLNRKTIIQALTEKKANETVEAAIVSMMKDLDIISRGDLRHKAVVSEPVLLTLADSINQTIEDLAMLIVKVKGTINHTEELSQGALIATDNMIVATKAQSQSVMESGQEVLRLTESVNHVSKKTSESADVAKNALEAAQKGGEAVQTTLKGMGSIRGKIDEVGHRVKRLTESSKEIGGITTLMTELAAQTSVLAVNASVQAAKAGEAGRGFRVVAEGIQSLAERSGDASKRVEILVKTALDDISATLFAVLKATDETDEGARLIDITNDALITIVDFSSRLAILMDEIALQTAQQSSVAENLSTNTTSSLQVARETSLQTESTAEAFKEVRAAVNNLSDDIKGFNV